MAGDAEHFRKHHPDGLHPVRNLDAGEFLDREYIREVVHHPAEIVDTVGIGDIAVPGLALGHFLGTAVVIADIRHAVDDFLAVQLQHDAKCAVCRRVVGTEVEEHVIGVRRVPAHAPLLGYEAQRLLLHVLLCGIQRIRVEFRGARRVVLA